MFTLVLTRQFERRLRRFVGMHPELRSRIARLLRELESDPFQPGLRLHTLRGELEGLHAASLTYAYRVVAQVRASEHEIVLLDIGTHDELYG